MKTRSKKPTPSTKITKTQEFQDPAITSASLSPNNANPPHLLILPTHASSSARVVTLPSPATSIPSRYFFCPETGFYEFTRIAAPKKKPCSWLLAPDANAYKPLAHTPGEPEFHEYQKSGQDATEEGKIISKGYVVENPDLILATPLDPLFLIVPILSPQTSSSLDDHKQLFLSIDDHLDALAAQSKHLKHLLRNAKLRDTLTSRAVHVCDTVEAGEETMYRLSMPKLLSELVAKAAKTVEQGRLPASLEAKFVKEALQAPISSTPTAVMTDVEKEGEQERATAHKEHLSETPSVLPQIQRLQRVRTALDFLLSSYIPLSLRSELESLLASPASPLDFTPLASHLTHLITLHRETTALHSISDNISRKRPQEVDEEVEELRAEKKRKKEEEDAKKKLQSRGVKQLEKVDTSGMKKLSAFFAPKVKAGPRK